MNNRGSKLAGVSAALIAMLMMLSVFAAPAAAASVGANGSPVDIPGNDADAEQSLIGPDASIGTDGTDDIDVTADADVQSAVKIDISDLEDAGVDLSNAGLNVNDASGGIAFSNLDTEDAEIQLVLDTTGAGGSTVSLGDEANDALTLTGIDTSAVSTAQDLEYVIRQDQGNSGDFSDAAFSTAAIQTTDTFNIATVEVENLDTGETVTETNLGDALAEADGDDELSVADGETTEVRLTDGTYQTDVNTLDGANPVRIVATDGAEPVIQSADMTPADPLIDITDADSALTVDGVTFDLNGEDVTALGATGQASDLTVTGSTFDNTGGSSAYINVDDAAGTVEVSDSSFLDANDNDPTHILASNDGAGNADLTLDNNVFNDTATAVDLSNTPEDFNSLTVQNNEFNNNEKHVDGAAGGTPDLDSIFTANTFDQYAITENNNGAIVSGTDYAIYGDLDHVNAGDVDTAQATTIVSEGDHDLSATISVSSDEVSLVAEEGTTAEDVTVSTSATAVDATMGISDLTISGITFDGSQTAFDANGNTINGLSVTDNRFVNLDSGTISIDASAAADTLNSFDITNNFFGPSADDGSNYDAVSVDEVVDPADGNDVVATISDNNITGTDGTAITVSALTDASGNNNDVLLTVSDNEIEVTGTTGNGGISLAALNVANDDEVVDVTGNAITAADGVGTTTAVDIDTSGDTTVNVLDNSITHFDNAGSVGLNIVDFGSNSGLTVENNDFDDNGAHIDFNSNSVDAASLDSNNNFATFVFDTTNKDETFEDQEGDVIYGTVGGGLDNAGSAGNYIQVRPGTYEESGLDTTTGSTANLVATGSASETVITTGDEATILNINSANEVDGFTFASTTDSADTDVEINTAGAKLSNSTFTGPGTENRFAVGVLASDADPEVVNVDVSDYSVGIAVDSTSGSPAGIQDSTVTATDTGVDVLGTNTDDVELVRNTITDNTVGVDVKDVAANSVVANFNDITNNEDASAQFADVDDLDMALANWWGDEAGPNVSEKTGADVVVDNIGDINDEQTRPWLDDSVDTLSQDGLVLVTDPSTPSADGSTGSLGDGALWLIATLDDDEASNVNADDITLTTQDGPDSLQNINRFTDATGAGTPGAVSAADPVKISSAPGAGAGPSANAFDESILPSSSTAGDYTVGVFDTGDNAESGTAVQSFTAPVAGVNVTADSEELVADDDTEATITLQLVDDNGEAVERNGVNTEFAISNSGAAGTSRVSTDATTDVNGQADLVVTADTAGETFTVTGIDTDADNSDTVSIDTVEQTAANFTVELVDGPTEVTQNESYDATVNVTNIGDSTGTQDIEYVLEDSNGLSSGIEATESGVELGAGESTEIDFSVPANATADLEPGDYTHVFSSDDDEITADVSVVEEGTASASVTFNDQSVQNGTEEVTVDSANFTRADGSAGDYVVVVHVVNDTEFDIGVDNSISAPVGASGNLSNGAESITVDLNSSAAFEDGDALDTLSENVTLRAMLHTTANDSAFGTRLGNAIDGIEPGDETDDADITVTPASPLDGPAAEFDADADGDISITELGDAGTAFAQGELTIAELGAVGQEFAS